MCTYIYIYVCVSLSIYLSISLSLYLSIYLYIYIYIYMYNLERYISDLESPTPLATAPEPQHECRYFQFLKTPVLEPTVQGITSAVHGDQ